MTLILDLPKDLETALFHEAKERGMTPTELVLERLRQNLKVADKKEKRSPRPYGLCAGEFTVPKDFDVPLPDDIVDDFYK